MSTPIVALSASHRGLFEAHTNLAASAQMTTRDILRPLVTRRVVPGSVALCSESGSLPMPACVSMTPRQKRVLGRELRDTVFRLCVGAGGLLGLLSDLHHPSVGRTSRPTCSVHIAGHAAISRFGHCFGSEFSSIGLSLLTPIAIGLLLGALVGALAASMIRLGPRCTRAR